MYNRIYYCILTLVWLACTASREIMYFQNVDYVYHPSTNIAYDLRMDKDSLQVYLKFADLTLFDNTTTTPGRSLNYVVSLRYDKAEIINRGTIPKSGNNIQVVNQEAYLDFKIEVNKLRFPSVLQLQIKPHPGEKESHWFDIPLTSDLVNKSMVLVNDSTSLPLFRSYVNTGQTFRVSQANSQKDIQIKHYEGDFPAALPPFSVNKKQVNPELKLISTGVVQFDKLILLPEKGLYIIESAKSVVPVMAVENAFPDLTSAEELIEPLLYITSSKERDNLYKAAEPKLALDKFWLNVADQDKNKAKYLIKTFYGRVKEANTLFSSHKAGWLTDRGMIYIIFGKPEVVNRRFETEEWSYLNRQQGRPVLKFIFNKKQNTFTQNHYELIRSPEYEFVWYSTVEKWRKGTVQEE